MMAQITKRRRRDDTPWTGSPLLVGVLAGLFAVAGGIVLAFAGPIAAVALVAAGVAAIVVLRDMEKGFWGVIAVITLLPFATVPVDIGITPTFLDVALGAVVGVWLLQLVTGKQRTIVTAPVTVPLLVFMVVAVFAFIFGLANGPLTSTLLRHFAELLLSLAFVLVVVDYATSPERLARLTKILLLAGAAAAALGILLWLLPDDTANRALNALQRIGYPGGWVIRYIEENPENAERAIGTSVDPNSFGGLLLLVGALAGPQLVAARPLFRRPLVVLMSGLIFVALILTFSRGAMVGLAAGLGFIALARYRRLLPYMLVGALLFLLIPATHGYVARFIAGLRGEDLATQMRFGEYADALTLIARYPVFGVGFAGSPDIDVYLGVANVYLTIAQQMGVLGLLAFFSLIAVVFGYAFFNRHDVRRDADIDPLWLGLHAALVGGLVAGVFDHYLFNINFHHAVTLFWMLVGMATAATRLGSRDVTAPATSTTGSANRSSALLQ
jgi:polysaccharide biosynthesis protein PslJ